MLAYKSFYLLLKCSLRMFTLSYNSLVDYFKHLIAVINETPIFIITTKKYLSLKMIRVHHLKKLGTASKFILF